MNQKENQRMNPEGVLLSAIWFLLSKPSVLCSWTKERNKIGDTSINT
jgi:hypothetical protein